jgi:Mce-associated membrane protein
VSGDGLTPDPPAGDAGAVERLRARAAARQAAEARAVAARQAREPAAEAPAQPTGAAVPTATADRPARRGPWREAAVVAAVIVSVAAAALAALATDHASTATADSDARVGAVGAASSDVATVLSYDYRHLDQDFAAAHRVMTASFRKQYDATTEKGVQPLATRYHAVSDAQVSAAGVVQANADRAIVLVFVNQTATNTQLTAPRLDRSRINVTLVRVNGHWLIDKLQTL